jgi:hypothetical protein
MFITQLRTFIEGLAKEISKVRTNIGIKDGLIQLLNDAELRKELKDKVVQKLLRNFTYITKS